MIETTPTRFALSVDIATRQVTVQNFISSSVAQATEFRKSALLWLRPMSVHSTRSIKMEHAVLKYP